jgi:phage-related protein
MAVFTWTPLYSWQSGTGRRVLITEFESGAEQRRDKGKKPREWELSFCGVWSVIEEIVVFFDARRGPLEAFQWSVPGTSETVNVRFKDEDLTAKREGLNRGSLTLTLREVF